MMKPPLRFVYPHLLASIALAGTTIQTSAQGEAFRLVKDANRSPGYLPANIGWIQPTAQGVVFPMDSLKSGQELWTSDGTTAGTILLKKDWYGAEASNSETGRDALSLSVVGTHLYFTAINAGRQYLWLSDGTTPGTREALPATAFALGSVQPAIDLNGVAIFAAHLPMEEYHHLWRHSGNQTAPVRDSVTGPQIAWDQYGKFNSAVMGNKVIYAGVTDEEIELWATDGTEAGTQRVKDIYPGPQSSSPAGFFTDRDAVYFSAETPEYGVELWRTDGTEEGTVLVADIEPGPNSSQPEGFKLLRERIYFTAERRTIGRELHSIDRPEED